MMIEMEGVGRTYGDVRALSDVTFSVGEREIVGLLGPNGAGKTTLMRVLTGYLEPSAGRISVDGVDVSADPEGVQQRVGYMPEQDVLYPDMLVQEYLTTVADLRKIDAKIRRSRLAEVVWSTGLEKHLTKPIGALSKGFKRRVTLAQAILHDPKVLILDEPTSGLDPTQVVQVRELVRRLAKNTTVLFSTHVLTEVEHLCERALVVLGGRLKIDSRLETLRSTHKVQAVFARRGAGNVGVLDKPALSVPSSQIVVAAKGLAVVKDAHIRAGGGETEMLEVEGPDVDALTTHLYRLIREEGWDLRALTPVVQDLETVFRTLVLDEQQQGAEVEKAA